jgi:hypothetical protein
MPDVTPVTAWLAAALDFNQQPPGHGTLSYTLQVQQQGQHITDGMAWHESTWECAWGVCMVVAVVGGDEGGSSPNSQHTCDCTAMRNVIG